MVDRAPVYCDICNSFDAVSLERSLTPRHVATRIQVAFNVAIPGCLLCIERQLYRVARMKSAGTDAENRRVLLIDLLIGVGFPVLQVVARE